MDSNRHHELIGGDEERQSAMYFNREIEDKRSNTQYYLQERVIVSNNKSCMCPSVSNNIMCNACPSTADGKWSQRRTARIDFENASVSREKGGTNSIYVHDSRHYYHPNNSPSYITEVLPNRHIVDLHQDRNHASIKNGVMEPNYNFKQQLQHQLQGPQIQTQSRLIQMQTQSNIPNTTSLPPQQIQYQHISAIDNFSNHILYDEKYQSSKDLSKNVKVGDQTTLSDRRVANREIYSEDNQGAGPITSLIEIKPSTKMDPSNIINPSNSSALKEQQASPNYARKCPQIFSHPDPSTTNSTHQSLYMSTPQFSSDKFTNIHAQRKISHESENKARGYIANNNGYIADEIPIIGGYTSNSRSSNSSGKYNPQQIHTSITQQTQNAPHHQEPIMGDSNSVVSRNQTCYMPSARTRDGTETEMPLVIGQSAHIETLYSNISKTVPSNGQLQLAVPQTLHHPVRNESVKQNNSDLYTQIYKSSSPLDSCCKDVSAPYDNASNSFTENIGKQDYYKYGNKIAKDTIVKTSICPQNQNTPPPTPLHRTAGYKTQPYIYGKYDGNLHNLNFHMSPNVSTVASPSPSLTTPPIQMQVHHSNITPHSRTQTQSPANYTNQNHNKIEINRPSVRTHHESAAVYPSGCFDAFDQPPQHSDVLNSQLVPIQPLQSQPIDSQIISKPCSNLSIQGQKQNSTKKAQVPKTNYRELINQVVAMRSATSEKELDLQIIKKALNSTTVSTEKLPQSIGASNSSNMPLAINSPVCFLENANRDTAQICVDTKLSNIQRTIKVEETVSLSPLDLSMRTVKTMADSTEYRYNHLLLKKNQIDYKHVLPKVDFTPNFSLHSNYKPYAPNNLSEKEQHVYSSSERSRATLAPGSPKDVDSQSQCVQHIKQYSTSSGVTTVAPPDGLVSITENLTGCQMRPSVVETNPFAIVKTVKSEPSSAIDGKVPTGYQLQPSYNVITLQKPNSNELPSTPAYIGSVIKTVDQISPHSVVNMSNTVNFNDRRNLNYLGRKRHLQEYSNSQRDEPVPKQQRYQERNELSKAELLPMATISTSVIALNERILDEKLERDVRKDEKCIQAKISPCCQRESSIIVSNNVPICKVEPITPNMDTPAPPNPPSVPIEPIKIKANSVISARIRTKAELKGFTFNVPVDRANSIKEAIQIKLEPSQQTCTSGSPSIPGLDEKYDSSSLIDFSWNNKCNDFMEQLLTRSQTKKRRLLITNPEVRNDYQNIRNTIVVGTTSNLESDENSNSWDKLDVLVDSTMTGDCAVNKSTEFHSSQSVMATTQKKINKQDREKLRAQQEKRIAARLQIESSSESDDEMNKRKSDRSKKPLKKAKLRQNTRLVDVDQFSDCDPDSSDTNGVRSSHTKVNMQMNKEVDIQMTKNANQEVDFLQSKKMSIQFSDKCKINETEKSNLLLNIAKSSESEDIPEPSSSKQTQSIDKKCTITGKQSKSRDIVEEEQENLKIMGKFGKGAKKPKVHLKLGLNTMTRSKRKREMELQLANSKVLRNDKIIRNSTTKIKSIKRKYERKFGNQSSVSAVCKDLSNKPSDCEFSMRLRSRNEKALKGADKVVKVPGSNSGKKINKTVIEVCKNDNQHTKSKKKERQSDIFMEVYRYKRSLKIPPSLITIDPPHNLKMAISLPDLEREDDSNNRSARLETSVSKVFQKSVDSAKEKSLTVAMKSQEQHSCDDRRSIIDVLHSRVINTNAGSTAKLKCKKNSNSYGTSRQVHSDVSRSAESTNMITDMSSIPVKKGVNEGNGNDGKKRHFSIFETTVLKTKTRTESKLQQRKEIIREIFVGDDRPASAPPEIISQMSAGNDKMTFEQKYEQFLQQLNIVINDDKLRKYGKLSTLSSQSASGSVGSTANNYVKDEEDTLASNGAADIHKNNTSTNKTGAEADSVTSAFRRRRPGKYLRRKGSSGFDYIRKKKKPNQSTSGNSISMQNAQLLGKLERKPEDESCEKKVKTESDVCREIQKWVLNKSVGQSTMHKAARLGYIDVIVYCLDRMGMNPDQKDNAGYTPLHEACTKGWLEIARVLLQYGANHSEAAHSGIRPLHEASENDHEEIVRLLLSYGADPLLATYSGQTPLMLASSSTMRNLLNNHLSDVQNVGHDRKPWRFKGPWEILDSSIYGYDVFGEAPNFTCDMSRALRKSSVSNSISNKKPVNSYIETGNSCKAMMNNCAVMLDNIDRFNCVRLYNDNKPEILVENSDSDGEMFEFEEADVFLPPLYLLKDEGTDKWVLLSDLCNLLKVKSKDTLLNKIYPPSSSASSTHKNLMRELKMSDFLEKATCLQLLCAGEKINICTSKVVLIKYNDSVRNLLGVKTILMKF